MRFFNFLTAALLFVGQVAGKAVFAHYMVDITENWSSATWGSDMAKAITYGVDAFVLNIAAGKDWNDASLQKAFDKANQLGFKLLFSFDYAGNGPWAKADVVSMIQKWGSNSAYFLHEGSKPLVSTFEGPENAADWVEIKRTTGCFFIPDWSSQGPQSAVGLQGGVADGLFSWDPWAWGGEEIDTYTDAAYKQFLGGKPYMMAVSPWFYTNLPGFNKNWMWPDSKLRLWAQRWNQILYLQPEYVQIISWNDYGESHYIGDIYETPDYATNGYATFDYITGMDHAALLYPLATWAQQYKKGKATIDRESLVIQYLTNPASGCNDGGTTINTYQQLQLEFEASAMSDRNVGVIATLASPADAVVTVGGRSFSVVWLYEPAGGAGVYYGVAALNPGDNGAVSASLLRSGSEVIVVKGRKSIGDCTDGYANYNPFVAGAGKSITPTQTKYEFSDLVCTRGTGANDFRDICSYVCQYGYCPESACVCQDYGLPEDIKEPKITGDVGYPRHDPNYAGLCSWAYNHGRFFEDVCTTQNPGNLPPLTTSPFLPEACTAGSGRASLDLGDGLDDLCGWLCSYGYCPISHCICTSTGDLLDINKPENVRIPDLQATLVMPPKLDRTLTAMCKFACGFGNCICEDELRDPESGLPEGPTCDWDRHFGSVEQLAMTNPNYFPAFCFGAYTLDILANDINSTLADLPAVDNGYDSIFGYYVKYVQKLVQPSIDKFMREDGHTYFECRAGIDGWDGTSPMKCPDPSALDGTMAANTYVDWKLVDEAFYDVLLTKYGILRDWVKFGSVETSQPCQNQSPRPGQLPCYYLQTWNNYPKKGDSIKVDNPKDFFTKAGPQLSDLPGLIRATLFDIQNGKWGGSVLDAVDAYSMPVALAAEALDGMIQSKDIAETEKESEMKQLILIILGAVLAVVPFVTEASLALAGLATAARMAAIAGETANLAFDIFNVIDNHGNAPFDIIGMLLGARGMVKSARTSEDTLAVAKLRRGMSAEDAAKMGRRFVSQQTSINKYMRACR
ncbi:glycosyl hydrolase family 71-domain-containing protein [Stachybotrys elegans]|uniref:Glycosyl hydrolase family 71-domain-containing protein n=1 Tax=Stachybotrys elegans TaxID=80388 RepID=A0A8K0WMI6_9HYPO|nr:glycosyl hydrolase family 71-domain-containing protein [Stachybotrys elegans]